MTDLSRSNAASRRDPLAALLVASVVLSGLIAGVYYCFACAVIPALGGVDDRVFIDVMQRVNVKIENPVFFLSFFGAFVVPVAAALVQRRRGGGAVLRWIVAGVVLHALSAAVTIVFNIPLNNELSDAGSPAAIADPRAVRGDFEDPWVAWNIVRTLLSTAAIAALGHAMLLRGRMASRPASTTER
ncbi:DUF1772 domain-containing protein [Yinghuangia sp. YIM S10712]|uniref:anthrone oxygenase family protein n=1 Tax=Yinghuangia sp. YIM S10712 TaxID=3436930 RepID=UPI003F52E254